MKRGSGPGLGISPNPEFCAPDPITPFLFINIVERMLNSFVFINIVERRKVDIFSTCVFNNLMKIAFIFYPFFFMTLATEDRLTILVSITYIFARFSLFIANPFCFRCIVESRGFF